MAEASAAPPRRVSRRALLLLTGVACFAPLLLLAIPPATGLLTAAPAGLFTSAWAAGFGANTIVGGIAGILTWAWRRRRTCGVDARPSGD